MAEGNQTLLHEMAFVYFIVAMMNSDQSTDELKTKMNVLSMKLSEWTEEKNSTSTMIRDYFIELYIDRKKYEGYRDKLFKCMAHIKAHIPDDQLIYVIDDMIEIVNSGRPDCAEFQMIGCLAEYLEVSINGEKYKMIRECMSKAQAMK